MSIEKCLNKVLKMESSEPEEGDHAFKRPALAVSDSSGGTPAARHRRRRAYSSESSTSDSDLFPPRKMKKQTGVRAASLEHIKHLGKYCYEWNTIYNKRALLSRIVVEEGVNQTVLNQSIQALKMVKYFTKKENAQVVCENLGILIVSDFEHKINKYSRLPKLEDGDLGGVWKEVMEGIKECNLSFSLLYEAGEISKVWFFDTGEDVKVPRAISLQAQILVSSLRTAYQRDIQNGDGKLFISDLSNALAKTFGVGDFVQMWSPSVHHGSNSPVEVLCSADRTNCNRVWNGRYTSRHIPESKEDYPHQNAKCEVTDFLWSTMGTSEEKGRFILVVEVKPDGQSSEGLFQMSKQLLSKMHEQDVGFGLVVTPQRFEKVFMYKASASRQINVCVETVYVHKERSASSSPAAASTSASLSAPARIDEFDVDAFTSVVEWLARIMKYAKKLKQNLMKDLVVDFACA